MLTNCMGMAIEEERVVRVKIAKLELDLQILKLEVGYRIVDRFGNIAACSPCC